MESRLSMKEQLTSLFGWTVTIVLSAMGLLISLYFSLPLVLFLVPLAVFNILKISNLIYLLKRGLLSEWSRQNTNYLMAVYISDLLGKVSILCYFLLGLTPFFAFVLYFVPLIIGFLIRKPLPDIISRLVDYFHIGLRIIILITGILLGATECLNTDWDIFIILFPLFFSLVVFSLSTSILLTCRIFYVLITVSMSFNDFLDIFFLYYIFTSTGVMELALKKHLQDNDSQYLLYALGLISLNLIALISLVLGKKQETLDWVETRLGITHQEEISECESKPKNRNWPKLFERVSNIFYKPINKKELRRKNKTNYSLVLDLDQESEHEQREKEKEKEKQAASLSVSLNLSMVFCPDENTKCMICCFNSSNSIIMNCGHGGICYECAKNLKDGNRVCHICRKTIDEIIEIKQDSLFAQAVE